MDLTAEYLRSVLDYDPETGVFEWRKRRQGIHHKRGLRAGSAPNACGYIQISVNRKIYLAHRLAWLWMTGNWPADQIDHINGERSDNRWTNLREATSSQQNSNTRISRNNTSGYKGVTWCHGKYVAQIVHNGKTYYLGRFTCPKQAAKVRRQKARELHGEFASG
jgi:hypothetical protein